MELSEDHNGDALIDLGAVTVETQGLDPDQPEVGIGMLAAGLTGG